MSDIRYGLGKAAEEHLVSGLPLTRLEAMILFGVQNLSDIVVKMRRRGWKIKSERVPLAKALVRLNKHAQVIPPRELPIREIQVTEYQLLT